MPTTSFYIWSLITSTNLICLLLPPRPPTLHNWTPVVYGFRRSGEFSHDSGRHLNAWPWDAIGPFEAYLKHDEKGAYAKSGTLTWCCPHTSPKPNSGLDARHMYIVYPIYSTTIATSKPLLLAKREFPLKFEGDPHDFLAFHSLCGYSNYEIFVSRVRGDIWATNPSCFQVQLVTCCDPLLVFPLKKLGIFHVFL